MNVNKTSISVSKRSGYIVLCVRQYKLRPRRPLIQQEHLKVYKFENATASFQPTTKSYLDSEKQVPEVFHCLFYFADFNPNHVVMKSTLF